MGWLSVTWGKPQREILKSVTSQELTEMRAYYEVMILGRRPKEKISLGKKLLAWARGTGGKEKNR